MRGGIRKRRREEKSSDIQSGFKRGRGVLKDIGDRNLESLKYSTPTPAERMGVENGKGKLKGQTVEDIRE